MLERMDSASLQQWIEQYERAWRTEGTDVLAELFTDDVVYSASPWADPITGLAALGEFWDAQRESAAEQFSMTSEIVALDGSVGVVRVSVEYGSGDRWRDLWIVRFDEDGRCAAFEEWPFAPNDSDGHS